MENEVLMSANAENKSEFIGIENADGRKSSSGEIFDESGEVDNSDSTLIANNNKIDSAAEEKNDKGNGGDGGQSNKASRKLRRGASLRSSRASSGARSRSRSRTYSRSRSRSHHSRSRTYSDSSDEPKAMKRRRKTSRSRSRSRCSRSNSSSSRDTYGSFRATSPTYQSPKYPCKKCDRRDFETIRELSEHEIRAHGAVIPCPHCSRDRSSVQKLVEHLNRRHGSMKLTCHYCKESFSSKIETAKQSALEEYRSHIYKECLKEKMYKHERLAGKSGAVAQRGRGRCPHGPPVKCKNFPNCPGDKCYYFHGYCRHDIKCIKKDCPFDHSNRPRTCLSCLRDLRAVPSRRSVYA